MKYDDIVIQIQEINDLAASDPLGLLCKLGRYAPPTDKWDIADVAYALREIHDVLTARLCEYGVLDKFSVEDESE